MKPSRDETLMGTAYLWAAHSTCSLLSVGAVISRDGRSLSTGYNGAPQGMPHCDHSECLCETRESYPYCPKHGACRTAVHAEANALAFAARYGLATDGAQLHTTHAPCLTCAMSIVNAGIVRVVYEHPYRIREGLDLLTHAGVGVVQMNDLRRQNPQF